jgi:hypothetical protein
MSDIVKYEHRQLLFLKIPKYQEAEEVAYTLNYFRDNMPWLFGDFLAQCEKFFSETYTQLVPESALKTLLNQMFVAKATPVDIRNLPLTHGHFSAVASIKDREEKIKWLQRAIEEKLTTKQFRALVRPPKKRKKKVCPNCGTEI